MGADAGPLWSQLSQRKTWEEPCLQRYNPICHRGQISQLYHPAGEGLCALAQDPALPLTLLWHSTEVTAGPPLGKEVQVRDRLHWKGSYWIHTDVHLGLILSAGLWIFFAVVPIQIMLQTSSQQCVLWDDSLARKLSSNSCHPSPATQLWHWPSHSFPEGTWDARARGWL